LGEEIEKENILEKEERGMMKGKWEIILFKIGENKSQKVLEKQTSDIGKEGKIWEKARFYFPLRNCTD
jgi:hypothetical protein